MIMLIVFWLMYLACSMRAKRRIYSASYVRLHKLVITLRIIYVLEKTIYGLKKTIYGWKRLFTGWKRLFTALTLFLQNSEFIFDPMTHF